MARIQALLVPESVGVALQVFVVFLPWLTPCLQGRTTRYHFVSRAPFNKLLLSYVALSFLHALSPTSCEALLLNLEWFVRFKISAVLFPFRSQKLFSLTNFPAGRFSFSKAWFFPISQTTACCVPQWSDLLTTTPDWIPHLPIQFHPFVILDTQAPRPKVSPHLRVSSSKPRCFSLSQICFSPLLTKHSS